LIEAIANAGGKLPERQVAIKVAVPLISALKQLHTTGIVHRWVDWPRCCVCFQRDQSALLLRLALRRPPFLTDVDIVHRGGPGCRTASVLLSCRNWSVRCASGLILCQMTGQGQWPVIRGAWCVNKPELACFLLHLLHPTGISSPSIL
jgi:hypothetical protein